MKFVACSGSLKVKAFHASFRTGKKNFFSLVLICETGYAKFMGNSKKNTESNHDGAYKKIFSHPEMVESLIRDFVPEDWVRELDFSTLKTVNKSFVTDEIRSRADDIIWKVRWKDSWVYVYLIIEFQSTVDPWMAVRTMVYTGLLYQDLIASKEVRRGDMLPPVFPLVLYNGLGAWTARQEIAELIAPMPRSLARYQPSHRYFLVDEGRMPEETLASMPGLSGVLVRMERASGPEELQAAVKALIRSLSEPRYLSLRRAFTVWIRRLLLGRLNLQEPIPEVCDLQEVDHMLAERMTQWTETWKQQGLEQGLEKGLQKGELIGQEKMLAKMIRKRFGNLFDIHFQERLRNATPEQLERWADRFLDAGTIEEIFEEEL